MSNQKAVMKLELVELWMLKLLDETSLHLTNRAWRRWGNSIPSAWNRSPIMLQKLKLRTKSQIAFRLLELKLNRITKDEDLLVSPTFAKPLVGCCVIGLHKIQLLCPLFVARPYLLL